MEWQEEWGQEEWEGRRAGLVQTPKMPNSLLFQENFLYYLDYYLLRVNRKMLVNFKNKLYPNIFKFQA